MKTYDEMTNDVLKRRDNYITKQKRRRKTLMMTAVPALAVVLIASAAIGLNRNSNIVPPVSPASATVGQTEEATTKAEEKERKTVVSFPAEAMSCYRTPLPGEIIIGLDVKAATEHYGHSDDVEYVIALDNIFSKDEILTGKELQDEYRRLTQKGYRLYQSQEWEYRGDEAHRHKAYRDIVVGVFTEEELNNFDGNPAYGYLFYFVITGDGSPIDFDESTATPWTYKN